MLFLALTICAILTPVVTCAISPGYDDQYQAEDVQYQLSLARVDVKTSNEAPLQQSAIIVGQKVVVSSTVDGELGNNTNVLYLVQAKDEDGIIQFVAVSPVLFPAQYASVELNSTWIPEQSGIYTIEVFIWRFVEAGGAEEAISVVTPVMEKGRINSLLVGPSQPPTSADIPEGISLNIEKIGKREFYQDRKVFLPTELTITKDESVNWEILAWPSIGPNHVITKLDSAANTTTMVFDYYRSIGIDENVSQIRYDEFSKSTDIGPLPQQTGRYFGFDWNQTTLEGTRVDPGMYQVYLTMPVLIGDTSTGDDKRARMILRSEPDYFTILEGEPNDLQHNLSLDLILDKTELDTGQLFHYSLALVNNGDHPEYLTVDSNLLDILPTEQQSSASLRYRQPCTLSGAGGIAYVWYFIHEQPLMPGAKLVIENNSQSGAPRYPGIYQFTGPVTVSIADEPLDNMSENDGIRASCIDVYSQEDPILLNVTAPTYDGIRLILGTDKQGYARNETVTFSLYIENRSSRPFSLEDVSPQISVKDSTGAVVFTTGYTPSFIELPVVAPHSNYRLDTIALTWDQKDYHNVPEGIHEAVQAQPGQYTVDATFVFPYLKSATSTITILE